jgi:hypothetical protein
MTPASELLLAYLRRATDRNVELKKVADNLRSELNYARKSRDAWKKKAKARRLALKNMTASRDLWRHRALTDRTHFPVRLREVGEGLVLDDRARVRGGDDPTVAGVDHDVPTRAAVDRVARL